MKKIFDNATQQNIADMSFYKTKKTEEVTYFIKPKISARLTFKKEEFFLNYLKEHPEFNEEKFKEIRKQIHLFRLYINFRAMEKKQAEEFEAKLIWEMEK